MIPINWTRLTSLVNQAFIWYMALLVVVTIYALLPQRKRVYFIPPPQILTQVPLTKQLETKMPFVLPEADRNSTSSTNKLLRDIQNQIKHYGAALPRDPITSDTRMVYLDRDDGDETYEPPTFTDDFVKTQFPATNQTRIPRIGRYYKEPAAYTRYGEDYVQLQ